MPSPNSFTPEDVDALVSWLEVTATVAGGYYHPQAPAAANLIRRLVALIKVKDEALEIVGCIIRDGEAPNDALTIIEETIEKPRECFTGTVTDADSQSALSTTIEGDGE